MRNNKPSVTISIINYNSVQDTIECLKSVLKTKYSRFDVYVLDNGSINDESLLIKKRIKNRKVKIIRSVVNLGFAGGNNYIALKAKSKYLVLLNNDTIVEPNWLTELVATAESDKNIATVQPKIKSYRDREYFEYAGAAGGMVDTLGYPYARGRIGFHVEKDVGQYDQVTDIFWASGACMLLNRRIFVNLGMLSDLFFFYHEETDLCWRIKRKGLRIVYTPKTTIYHKGSGSSRNDSSLKIYYVHRNALYLIVRNLFLRELLLILPIRIILDYFTMIIYITKYKQPRYSIAILKSHFMFFLNFYRLFNSRMFKEEKFSKSDSRYPFSVFFNHYMLKQKNFLQLSGIIFPIETVNIKERFNKI